MVSPCAHACAASDERPHSLRGFSLLEALVAMAVAAVAALATAQLIVVSARTAQRADHQSTTAVLAGARLEQLQSLPWWFVEGAGGALEPISDTTTDLGGEPIGAGGRGLSAGPMDALLRSTASYAEYLNRDGRSLGFVPGIPAGAYFVRRWSVSPSTDDPGDTLVLGVRVTPLGADLAAGDRTVPALLPGETWLVTLRSRTRP
jgi:prepilin-type N-terminal cleavage/methylation domain-containing protein